MRTLLFFSVLCLLVGCADKPTKKSYDCSAEDFSFLNSAYPTPIDTAEESDKVLRIANDLLRQLCFFSIVSDTIVSNKLSVQNDDISNNFTLTASFISASVAASFSVLSSNTQYLQSIRLSPSVFASFSRVNPIIISIGSASAISAVPFISSDRDKYIQDSLRCREIHITSRQSQFADKLGRVYSDFFILSPTATIIFSQEIEKSLRSGDSAFTTDPNYLVDLLVEEHLLDQKEFTLFKMLNEKISDTSKKVNIEPSIAKRLKITNTGINKMIDVLRKRSLNIEDTVLLKRINKLISKADRFMIIMNSTQKTQAIRSTEGQI